MQPTFVIFVLRILDEYCTCFFTFYRDHLRKTEEMQTRETKTHSRSGTSQGLEQNMQRIQKIDGIRSAVT